MSLPARTSPVRLLAAAGAALVAAVVAGCAPADSSSSASGAGTSGSAAASGSASAAACSKDQLATKTKGKLTIATDKPVYEPWFKDDKPENGQGFEGAVAYAVAQKLGYAQGDVTWSARLVRLRHPARAEELRLRHQRGLDHRQAQAGGRLLQRLLRRHPGVITVKGSKIANAKSIAELRDAKIGAQVGTTSLDTIKTRSSPRRHRPCYNTNDDAAKALGNGQIDGLVMDLPTAFFITGSGQVRTARSSASSRTPPAALSSSGSSSTRAAPLTSCVSQAVDALRADGSLKKLEQQWLAQTVGAPVLQ